MPSARHIALHFDRLHLGELASHALADSGSFRIAFVKGIFTCDKLLS